MKYKQSYTLRFFVNFCRGVRRDRKSLLALQTKLKSFCAVNSYILESMSSITMLSRLNAKTMKPLFSMILDLRLASHSSVALGLK